MSKPPVAYITDRVTASRALSEAYRHDTVAIDTEFNSDDGTIETLQYSWGSGVRVVVAADLLDIFADWLVDPKIRKVYQNYKADREALVELGFYPDELDASFHADIMIETALHDENDRLHDLKHQSKKWLGWPRLPYSKLFAYPVPGRKKPAVLMPRELLRSAPPDALAVRSQAAWRQLFLEYAGDDPESTILCHFVHRQYLEEIGYWQNYQRVDREYTLTLIKMQARGVKIDKQGMQSIRQKVIARKTRAGFCFRQLAGKPDFNFRSAPQKKALYIDELKWPVRDDFLTDKGLELMRFAVTEADKRVIRENFASFSGEAMQWWCDELDHPLAKLHLQTAKAQTLEVTVTGILAGLDQDNYIYTDFNQVGGQLTGRISSRKQRVSTIETYTTKRGIVKTRVVNRTVGMQLQNMPSKVEKDPFRIRDEFICEPGEVVVCADYAGFELMMALFWAAKFTPHSRMLDIMRKYKTPSAIHAFTAIEMMNLGGCGIDQVKKLHPDEYLYAKNVNFLLIYGGSWKRLCQQITQAGVSGWDWRDQYNKRRAKDMIAKWNDLYPEIAIMQQALIAMGYNLGYVETIAGRRIHVAAGLASRDEGIRGHWERKCINGPCQGSAADIVKDAQNRIELDPMLRGWGYKQRLQVHDEILGTVLRQYAEEACARKTKLMKQPYAAKMPFEIAVDAKYGRSWQAAK